MSFDVYGQSLRRGHCEVHPDIHEPWPCYYCLQENQQHQINEQQEAEYYGEMESQHIKMLIADHIVNIFSTA